MIVCHLLQQPSGPESFVVAVRYIFRVVCGGRGLAERCASGRNSFNPTRTLSPPRCLRVFIRFSAAALRQVAAVFSEPDCLPSE
jgi:hypothetical protein